MSFNGKPDYSETDPTKTDFIKNKPTSFPQSFITGLVTALAAKFTTPSGTTGQYVKGDGSLGTFPTIPAAQVQSDMTQTSNAQVDYIKNKNTYFRAGAQILQWGLYSGTATVSGGNVVFNITTDGTSTGTACFPNNVFTETANILVYSNTGTYQFGTPTVSMNKKQITFPITVLGTTQVIITLISVLTGVTFVSPANGITVNLSIMGN